MAKMSNLKKILSEYEGEFNPNGWAQLEKRLPKRTFWQRFGKFIVSGAAGALVVAGVLVASPYIIYVLFRFVQPALYEEEQRMSLRLISSAYTMFILGVLLNYLLIFPLTLRFLATYSVSADVETMLTLSSYVDTLLMMSIVFGIVFEIPVVAWLLARFGLLKAQWMSEYRRHAIVAILIVAAIITPTSDVMTLLIVSLPIWLLYEASIWIVKLTTE